MIWRGLGFPRPARFRGVGRAVVGGEAFDFALSPKNTKVIGAWSGMARDRIAPYDSTRTRRKPYTEMAQAVYQIRAVVGNTRAFTNSELHR